MATLLAYSLKLSISLALVSLFYYFVLRKLTFYNWNRYYFLVYSLLSFYVSFIDISPLLQQEQWPATHFVKWIPPLDAKEMVVTQSNPGSYFTVGNLLAMLVITGVAVMGVRLLVQIISLKRLTSKAELSLIEGIKFYKVKDSIIPFSFGNSIFVNAGQHSDQELKEIIRHEFVHVKQKHSIDIVFAELLCLLNWYNPFAWLLKRFIRENLEFIADNNVLKGGINKRQYQYLLLKVVGDNQFSIASQFNFSSLKKRIAMMNTSKSARLNLVRFLFALPFVAVLLIAFRNNESMKKAHNNSLNTQLTRQLLDTVPTPPKTVKPGIPASNKKLSALSDDYEINEDRALIHLKDGRTEEYDLHNKEQRKNFEDKYGKIVSVNVHQAPTTAVSELTSDGVATTVAPVAVTIEEPSVKVVTTGSGKGVGNGTGSRSVCVTNSVSAVTTVTTANENIVPITTNIPMTNAVIASTGSPTAVSIAGEDGNLIAVTPEVLFTITKNTTQQQLDELKKQMKEKGFDLNFKETKYNSQGKLISIAGTIQSKDATGRFSSSTFNKVIVSVLIDGNHTYFRIDDVQKRVI